MVDLAASIVSEQNHFNWGAVNKSQTEKLNENGAKIISIKVAPRGAAFSAERTVVTLFRTYRWVLLVKQGFLTQKNQLD